MRIVLLLLLDLAILAMIILIVLRFRLDRLILRIEMQWSVINSLLRDIVKELLETKRFLPGERQKIDAFMKSRKQEKQVTAANELNDFLALPKAAYAEIMRRREEYNSAVGAFNQKLEAPVWKVIAAVFRMKPRTEFAELKAVSNVPERS